MPLNYANFPHKHPYISCFTLSVSRGKYINLKNNKIVFALYTQISIILIEYCIVYKNEADMQYTMQQLTEIYKQELLGQDTACVAISNSDCISGLVTNLETNVSQDTGDLKQLHTIHTFCTGKFECKL